jgi:hypothetical protein
MIKLSTSILVVWYVVISSTSISPRGRGRLYFVYGASDINLRRHEVVQRGHSHNDYSQDNPLESALFHGMTSIEVDVFPMDNQLLVGHNIFELEESIDSM